MTPSTPARPTIRDVAAAAGVSVTTVSHALNNKGRVDPATRARVEVVAQRLGYTPSRTARGLRGVRTMTIALLLPPFGDHRRSNEAIALENFMRIATSAASTAHAHRHSLLLVPPTDPFEDKPHDIDGAVVVDPVIDDPRVATLEALDLPLVTIEQDLGRPDFPWHVSLDVEQGMRALLEHLVEQGAGRLCVLAPEADWAWSTRSVSAIEGWCAEHELPLRIVPVSTARLEGSAYEAASLALDGSARPDALIALAERFSTGALRAVGERGLGVPADLLVATGADTFHARAASPPLTAMDMQPELTAQRAVEMLLARLDGAAVTAPVTIPYPLHVRRSTQRVEATQLLS
jgi:DNA-binding LacI/PurR family transcriptional regulator